MLDDDLRIVMLLHYWADLTLRPWRNESAGRSAP